MQGPSIKQQMTRRHCSGAVETIRRGNGVLQIGGGLCFHLLIVCNHILSINHTAKTPNKTLQGFLFFIYIYKGESFFSKAAALVASSPVLYFWTRGHKVEGHIHTADVAAAAAADPCDLSVCQRK